MYHKYISCKFLIAVSICALIFQSCTKGFERMNTNPVTPEVVDPENVLTGAEKSASDVIYNNFVNGRVGMIYAQFYTQPQSTQAIQYLLDESNTNNTFWGIYSNALSNLDEVVRLSTEAGNPNQVAIANILSVWVYQVLTDAYGNVPYSAALKGVDNLTPVYDDSKAIYDSLLNRLDQQIAQLNEANPSFGAGDVIYNGDVTKWKKLANSLKLRIGIRMVKAEPAKAQQVIESAFKEGLISSSSEEASFKYSATVPDQFPFNEQSGTLTPNDYFLTATVVDFMKATDDPRLPIYARPASASNTIIGKPYNNNQISDLSAFSYPGSAVYRPTFPGYIMSYSEVCFALAEAAARGFNVGQPAATYYENGVLASMQFWGVADTVATAYLKKIPYDQGNWVNVIGTQKWLALFNQGLQAWFERNRLNFKNLDGSPLFVAPNGTLDPTVKMVPYRLTYPTQEASKNKANYTTAGQAIGGDTKGTRLWWQ